MHKYSILHKNIIPCSISVDPMRAASTATRPRIMPVSERISKLERAEKPKKRKKKAKPEEPPAAAVTEPLSDTNEKSTGARNFALAAACMNLPSRAEVLALDGAGQRACFKQLGDTTHRLVRLMGDVQSACSTSGMVFEHDEDAMVADMAKLRAVPMARQFVEHALWRRVKRFTDGEVDKINAGTKNKNGADKEEFRSSFAQTHAEELDSIREREQLDEGGVHKLLKCVDEAAALYTAALNKNNYPSL